jgi:hypothetical protein
MGTENVNQDIFHGRIHTKDLFSTKKEEEHSDLIFVLQ